MSEKTYIFVRVTPSHPTYHILPDKPREEATSPALCGARPGWNYGGCWAETSTDAEPRQLCGSCLRVAAHDMTPEVLEYIRNERAT